MKLAIVTTIKNINHSFYFWQEYHLKYFDILYIFFDSYSEYQNVFYKKDLIVSSEKVKLLLGNQKSNHRGCSGVMQRQCNNVISALSFAQNDGVDWLLHIDSDELFYPNNNIYWHKTNVSHITFANHEMLHYIENPDNVFKDCHYFKLNSVEQGWNYQLYPYRFLYYGNGKSAVKVSDALAVNSVHYVICNGKHIYINEPCILHYPVPTYQSWLDKYITLGEFSNYWWDDKTAPIELTFHTQSRDIIKNAISNNCWEEAKKFYKKIFIPNAEKERLLSIKNVKYIFMG